MAHEQRLIPAGEQVTGEAAEEDDVRRAIAHDLVEIVRPGLAGVVLPKAETAEELVAVDSGIAAREPS